MKRGIPECVIHVGDKIIIREVRQHFIGDSLDHAHDAQIRYALLNVIRSSGKTEAIKGPIRFTGVTKIFGRGSRDPYFEKICRRICQHFHVRSLAEIDLREVRKKEGDDFASDAASQARKIAGRIGELRKLADGGEFGDPLVRTARLVSRTADQAVYLGYLWAKAEAEIGLKPLARSALAVKAGAKSGGAKSGEERRRKRAETWEPNAKKLAMAIRAKNPTFSQDGVATTIAALWKDETCPGHPTLKDLISRMEKAGELPKRQRT